MSITFKIDLSNSKALAFLEFIKTLEFVKVLETENQELTYQQKQAIDQGIQSLDEGKRISHSKVINQFKEQYPEYFTK